MSKKKQQNELNVASIAALLSGDGLKNIAGAVDAPEEDVAKVLSSAIPTLIDQMKTNASTEDGAASLSKALGDHSGADLTDLSAFLGGVDTEDGAKILGHVLGAGQSSTADAMSERSGLSTSQVLKIMAMLAPLLLSLLGKQQNQVQQTQQVQQQAQPTGLGSAGLMSLLGGVLGGGSGAGQQQASNDDLATIAMSAFTGGSNQQSSSGGLLSGLLNLLH